MSQPPKQTKQTSMQRPPWEITKDEAPSINIEARFRTGDAYFFPYAYLAYCRYDRGGMIELQFSSRTLRIEGRHLDGLFAALGKQAVLSVQEGDHDHQTAESSPFVSQLTVSESED